MNSCRLFVVCVFLGAIAQAADLPATTATDAVGMIVDYSPARSTHTIRRAGSMVPVKLGTLLIAGDVIVVGAGGHVVVQLNDDTQHDVGPGEWSVPAAKPLGPIASLL